MTNLHFKVITTQPLDRGIQYRKFFRKEVDYPVKPDNDNNGNRVRYGYSELKNTHFTVVT